MTQTMHLLPLTGKTISDLANELEAEEIGTVTASPENIRLHAADDLLVIRQSARKTVELPWTTDAKAETQVHVASALDIPPAFLKRIDPDLQETLVNGLLDRVPQDGDGGVKKFRVRYTTETQQVFDMRPDHLWTLDPRDIVGVAMKTIGKKADVSEYVRDSRWMHLDVIVPEGFDRGIGGDKRAGDLTRGGVRYDYNMNRNLAPEISQYMWRILCTNGMGCRVDDYKIDLRETNTVEQVIKEMERISKLAFTGIEGRIKEFYATRGDKVDKPEQLLTRIGLHEESPRLTPRLITSMIERMPGHEGNAPGDMSHFDFVSLVTNQANHPDLAGHVDEVSGERVGGRLNTRRQLQNMGGRVLAEHIERCRLCASRLN